MDGDGTTHGDGIAGIAGTTGDGVDTVGPEMAGAGEASITGIALLDIMAVLVAMEMPSTDIITEVLRTVGEEEDIITTITPLPVPIAVL